MLANVAKWLVIVVLLLVCLDDVRIVGYRNPQDTQPEERGVQPIEEVSRHVCDRVVF